MTLTDYLTLFSGRSREDEKLTALAELLLRQALDLKPVVAGLAAAWSPERAEGAQLDGLAASCGLSRRDAGEDATDEAFRDFLRRRLLLWTWDGTNESVPALLQRISPGASQRDNGDGSVTIRLPQGAPADTLPVPAGIRMVRE